MSENGGNQPNPTPADSGRGAPIVDVVRRPVDAPANRSEIAPPPPEVMEQIAPKEPPQDNSPVANPPADATTPAPEADAVQAAPQSQAEQQPDNPEQLLQDTSKQSTAEPAPKPVKQPKQSSGIAGPIIATALIVLLLAGLAVYAYLKSQ